MSLNDHLHRLTAPEIADALGCPLATAYDWKSGRRSPPEWQQPHWERILDGYQAKRAKPTAKRARKS